MPGGVEGAKRGGSELGSNLLTSYLLFLKGTVILSYAPPPPSMENETNLRYVQHTFTESVFLSKTGPTENLYSKKSSYH